MSMKTKTAARCISRIRSDALLINEFTACFHVHGWAGCWQNSETHALSFLLAHKRLSFRLLVDVRSRLANKLAVNWRCVWAVCVFRARCEDESVQKTPLTWDDSENNEEAFSRRFERCSRWQRSRCHFNRMHMAANCGRNSQNARLLVAIALLRNACKQ